MDLQNNTPQTENVTADSAAGDLWSEIEEYTLHNPIIIPSSNVEQNQPFFQLQVVNYHVPNVSGLIIPIFPLATITAGSSSYTPYQQGQQPGGLTKRKRPRLKPYQLDFLEKTFEEIKFPTPYEIECFRLVTDLPELRIKVWFQRRRTKWRKEWKTTAIPEENG